MFVVCEDVGELWEVESEYGDEGVRLLVAKGVSVA